MFRFARAISCRLRTGRNLGKQNGLKAQTGLQGAKRKTYLSLFNVTIWGLRSHATVCAEIALERGASPTDSLTLVLLTSDTLILGRVRRECLWVRGTILLGLGYWYQPSFRFAARMFSVQRPGQRAGRFLGLAMRLALYASQGQGAAKVSVAARLYGGKFIRRSRSWRRESERRGSKTGSTLSSVSRAERSSNALRNQAMAWSRSPRPA